MTLAVLCASHAPLAAHPATYSDAQSRYYGAMKAVGQWVSAFDPEIIFQFAPDHFNGLFYDAMPNFCIGAAADSVGDWQTGKGPMDVPSALALSAVEAVRAADIDLDLSYNLAVDHGSTQLLELMFGRFDSYKVIPIVINCAAPPLPSFRRARLLGEALGRFAGSLNKRVLFIGSGGLSHDPPIPRMATADAAQRALLLGGRNLSPEMRARRENRVVAEALDIAAGRSARLLPDADWDADVIRQITAGRLTEFDDWEEASVTRIGGCGGHEVRTWIAAFAALATAGSYLTSLDYYEAVPIWLTGMGVMRGAGSPELLEGPSR